MTFYAVDIYSTGSVTKIRVKELATGQYFIAVKLNQYPSVPILWKKQRCAVSSLSNLPPQGWDGEGFVRQDGATLSQNMAFGPENTEGKCQF